MSRQPPGQPVTIDQAHLRRVRNLARESGRSVLAELEHLNNGTSDILVQQLAVMFGMTAIDLTGLLRLMPASDLLPLPLAQQWQCMLLRDTDGIISGVLADPFDPDLQLWLNNQAHGTVLLRIASSTDLRSCLATWASQASQASTGDGPPSLSRELPASLPAQDSNQAPGEAVEDAATRQMLALTRDLLRRAMRRS